MKTEYKEVKRGTQGCHYLLESYTRELEQKGYFVSSKTEERSDGLYYILRGSKN